MRIDRKKLNMVKITEEEHEDLPTLGDEEKDARKIVMPQQPLRKLTSKSSFGFDVKPVEPLSVSSKEPQVKEFQIGLKSTPSVSDKFGNTSIAGSGESSLKKSETANSLNETFSRMIE